MFGWTRRCLAAERPYYLPASAAPSWPLPAETGLVPGSAGKGGRNIALVCLLLFSYAFSVGARLLELPYWDNPEYMLGEEYLLATHDAYHWIAGAAGFEFGAGHSMSELVRVVSEMTGLVPANAGFWMPPFLGGLLAVAVFFWGAFLGFPFAGACAGVLSSLAPSFFARTMLGFYDTDLVILLFAVLLGLVPAIWMHPWLATLPDMFVCRLLARRQRRLFADSSSVPQSGLMARLEGVFSPRTRTLQAMPHEMAEEMLALPWLLALVLSGLFGFWTQQWHSFFPYLVRYSALLLPSLVLLFGPVGGRLFLMQGGLCHVLPLLAGIPGALVAISYALLLKYRPDSIPQKEGEPHGTGQQDGSVFAQFVLFLETGVRLLARLVADRRVVAALWGVVLALCFDATVFALMKGSFLSYVSRGGDAIATARTDLVFPSVAPSIIEVQTIGIMELLSYCYPNRIIMAFGLVAVAVRLAFSPVLSWFLPLLALCFMSLYMGGRMTMFGPPVFLLAFCIEGGRFALFLVRLALERFSHMVVELPPLRPVFVFLGKGVGMVIATVTLSWPLIALIPDYTQGPIITREHAEGLHFLQNNSPKESVVWNWWDWGYATHHFARRTAIADGARHGGASLYLPAVIYTTADPRFARQVIKYTALEGGQPGEVFADLNSEEAQSLMRGLGDKTRPLIKAPGKQYVVASFELLRLGLWVTRYGSWNFVRKSGSGALMNNIYQGLEYGPESGRVATDDGEEVEAASIDVFDASGLTRYTYPGRRGNHFIFNMQSHIGATTVARKAEHPLVRFWEWQRGHFYFTAPTSDKMVLDPVFYNTLMVQLLIGKKDSPAIAPYFRCVFDNVFCRVYEVL